MCTLWAMRAAIPGGSDRVFTRRGRAWYGITRRLVSDFTRPLGAVLWTDPTALTRDRDGVPAHGDGAGRGSTEVMAVYNAREGTVGAAI